MQCGKDRNCGRLHWPQEPPPVPELTVDGDGPRGSLGADRVAGGAGVLPGIAPPGRVDDQGAAGDRDPGVGHHGCAVFAPPDADLRPGRPRAAQRHVSPLRGNGGSREADPSHCICKEGRRKCFRGERQLGNGRAFHLLKSSREELVREVGLKGSWYLCRPIRFDAARH